MKTSISILFIFSVLGTTIISCKEGNTETSNKPVTNDSLIARGGYLVTVAGCGDCHSPKVMTPMGPVPDTTMLLSGYRAGTELPAINTAELKKGWALFNGEGTAMVSPLGVSFAANITSDKTGIGMWRFEQFKTALTKGKYKGLENGRDLLPPMPWQNYRAMKEEDLQAIFAYLKSTKPVRNVVPAPLPVKL